MKNCAPNSFQAIISDPPYSLEEFKKESLEKMKRGSGGVWRIPPKIGGHERSPLPRFTVFKKEHFNFMQRYFREWGKLAYLLLVPGEHILIASTPIFLGVVSSALVGTGFEPRGIIVRLVQTIRSGFRPKNEEEKYENISTMPRAHWEPWGLFRKPLEKGLTIAENLRAWKAGGLRREPDGRPFPDVIPSEKTPKNEREIAPHPTLKLQSFMRRLVWASLPLGEGKILDPFSGAGSTLAAAEAMGYESVGVEVNPEYFKIAKEAIPKLAKLEVNPWFFEERIKEQGKMMALTNFLLSETDEG